MKGSICMMRIRPASGERSVKDRKAGVKGWTIFLRPLSVIAREYPITPGLFCEVKPTVGQ
ncbi:hypothetical protein MUTS15_42210 [Escherichia coli]|nr:hypothetical protein MUTS15_42210 [Escherichia coli]BDZ04130.1 hypothetical protein MUTS16_52030 [Escherichia coli]